KSAGGATPSGSVGSLPLRAARPARAHDIRLQSSRRIGHFYRATAAAWAPYMTITPEGVDYFDRFLTAARAGRTLGARIGEGATPPRVEWNDLSGAAEGIRCVTRTTRRPARRSI